MTENDLSNWAEGLRNPLYEQALQLRESGLTFEDIGREMLITRERARQFVHRGGVQRSLPQENIT